MDHLVTEEPSLISGLMENDPYMDYPLEAFQTNTTSSWMRIPGLKPFAVQRHKEISETLESLQIECNATGNVIIPDKNLLQLYPVPADNWVNIGTFPNKTINVSILNTFGQVVLCSIIYETGKIDLSALNSGCYVVRANVDAKNYTRLLMVKHD